MKALEYKKFAIGVISSSEIKMLHFKRYLNRFFFFTLYYLVPWIFYIKLILKVSKESVAQTIWKSYWLYFNPVSSKYGCRDVEVLLIGEWLQ